VNRAIRFTTGAALFIVAPSCAPYKTQ
jgi:hypothetical protein